MNITFEEKKHTYAIDGSAVPSVTTVLRDVLGNQFEGLDPIYMQRGLVAHALYHLLATGEDLGSYEFDERLRGNVEGWQAFIRTSGAEILGSEMRVGSKLHRYAGTLDLLCVINGKTTVVDYKSTATKRDALQLAGYVMALNETKGIKADQAVSVEINGDGGFKMGKILSGARLRGACNEWLIIRKAAEIKEKMK